MRSIDPVSLNYLLVKKTRLTFPLDCVSFEEVKSKLSNKQIEKIMFDFGKYLGELHQLTGSGYGFIDASLLDNYELKGSHKTWYDFWKENFDTGFKEMKKIEIEEKKTRKYRTNLSNKNRILMHELLDRKSEFLEIFEKNKKLINSSEPHFLNGNLYTKNITLRKGKFVGLADFQKSLLGDPVNELAYFSVMPEGNKYFPLMLKGWKTKVKVRDFEEKLHLYRLIESYRKIFTRYITHRYLDTYPEPLKIAQEELKYYNIK